RDIVGGHDIAVQDFDTVGSNSAHRELRLPWKAELAHHKYIERGVKRSSNLGCYRHPAARECQNKHIRTACIVNQMSGENVARFPTILGALRLHPFSSCNGCTDSPSQRAVRTSANGNSSIVSITEYAVRSGCSGVIEM